MLHRNIRGKSLHAPTNEIVENNTGFTLPKLKVVAFSGMGVRFPEVVVANPLLYTSFGIVQSEIETGKAGYITCIGLMTDVNTSLFAEGDILYSDISGNLTTAPLASPVALVVKSSPTEGVLYVFAIASFLAETDGIDWNINGNVGTDPSVNYLGTRDSADLSLRTDGIERARILSDGKIGIGTALPTHLLDINGDLRVRGDFIVEGTHTIINTTETTIKDKLLTLNSGGLSAADSGIEFEENAIKIAHIKINGTRDGIGLKAPTTENFNLNLSELTFTRSQIAQDRDGILALQSGLSLTSGAILFSDSFGLINESPSQFFWDASLLSLGLGTSSISTSAKLQIDSTTKGLLIPRMTTAQRDAIASPATGLQVYNTTTNQVNFYNGTQWLAADFLQTQLSGDVSGLYNNTTVDKIKNVAVTPAVYAVGQTLRYNGTSYVNERLTVSDIDGILPVSKGGTNSGATLLNNRVMISSAGSIVENTAITGNRALISTSQGLPTHSTVTDLELSYLSGVSSSVQDQLNNKQPLDADLTALAGLTSTGILVRTGNGTVATRSIAVAAGRLTVINADGIAADPSLDLATTAVSAGQYGSVSQVPQFDVDQYGRITGVTNLNILIQTSQVQGFDEAVQDALADAFAAGTQDGVSVTYSDVNNSFDITNLDKGSVAVDAHELEANPHPQYLLQAESDEIFETSGEPTGFPNRTDSIISFDNTTRTFTITPVGASFDIFIKAQKITISNPLTYTIPNTAGTYFIAINASGQLVAFTNFPTLIFKDFAYVANFYWSVSQQKILGLGEERHGLTMDWATHTYLHRNFGARVRPDVFQIGNFVLNGPGTSDNEAQASFENGVLTDEDIDNTIVNAISPSAPFEQILSPIARLPIMYKSGASGEWIVDAATDFLVKTGVNRIQWNEFAVGVWSATEAQEGDFIAVWVFATNYQDEPIRVILGQLRCSSLDEARECNTYEKLNLSGLPAEEHKILYRLIFQTSVAYANSVNARLVEVLDLRKTIDQGDTVNPPNDHGNLTGLADDDHLQYIKVDGTRPFTGSQSFGNNAITNVSSVNGVVVETHAARHLPNGADPLSTGAPSTISTANSEGTANAFARQDHVHNHGSQTDPTHHAVATQSANGFMSSADKTKLDGISGQRVIKSGNLLPGAFTGSPRTATVTFATPMPNINYSISVTGEDSRTWRYQNKTVNGFTINTGAFSALSGEVSWTAISNGESVE